MSEVTHPSGLVEHYFRHEYGRLVAVLVGRVGLQHLEEVEDAVQVALMEALTRWVHDGTPDNPSGWLFRVASNHVLAKLRQSQRRERILLELPAPPGDSAGEAFFEGEVRDELLRMLFACCSDAIPAESRLVLALKTLCGFNVSEIAFRLFTSETNVYKRLARARARLRERGLETATPALTTLRARLSSVHDVLYLLFNEGYLSTREEHAIRIELCDEAMRLTTLLTEHPAGATPGTFALLALMHLHAARFSARQDASGGLLLLEEQDRRSWDGAHLQRGAAWLQRAAQGDELSRFHVEAGIAAEHCFAPSFAETDWDEIADLYGMLQRLGSSPLHVLNRAVAMAEGGGGPRAGLQLLEQAALPAWLRSHYLHDAVAADLLGRAGELQLAEKHRAQALAGAPSTAVRVAIERRLRRWHQPSASTTTCSTGE